VSYILEKINSKYHEKIFLDASHDKEKSRLLAERGGYLKRKASLTWAIDRGINSYLFLAPKMAVMSSKKECYYYFSGKIYQIILKARSEKVVYIKEEIDKKLFTIMNEKIAEAFLVHGHLGGGKMDGPAFLVELKALK